MDKKEIADQVRLDVQLCFSAYSLSHAFSRFYRPMLDKLGLTYPQFIVMMVLWERGKITMKELTDLVMLESNTLTPLLKKLEAAGLVKRTRNREDERLLSDDDRRKDLMGAVAQAIDDYFAQESRYASR